jgi:hypothetical protein
LAEKGPPPAGGIVTLIERASIASTFADSSRDFSELSSPLQGTRLAGTFGGAGP